MSYEVPSDARDQRMLRKQNEDLRNLIRMVPQSTNANTEDLGGWDGGAVRNTTGNIMGRFILNSPEEQQAVKISWTSGRSVTDKILLKVGDYVATNAGISGTNWLGRITYISTEESDVSGTCICEPQFTAIDGTTPRSAFNSGSTTSLQKIKFTPSSSGGGTWSEYSNTDDDRWNATYNSTGFSSTEVAVQTASMIMNRRESTGDLEISNIWGATADGQMVTIKPKDGKTLTLKTGGNIEIDSDVSVVDTEIRILQYHEDGGNKWRLISGSGSGSSTSNTIKQPCRVASTGNYTTPTLIGSQVDGVTIVVGDRVLYKNQSTARDNGIYVCTNIATIFATMERAEDFDEDSEVKSGVQVAIEEGTVHADEVWQLTTNNPIVVGTTALTWAKISGMEWSTPVDASIIPDTDITYNLGSNTKHFTQTFTNKVQLGNATALSDTDTIGSVNFSGLDDASAGYVDDWASIKSIVDDATSTNKTAHIELRQYDSNAIKTMLKTDQFGIFLSNDAGTTTAPSVNGSIWRSVKDVKVRTDDAEFNLTTAKDFFTDKIWDTGIAGTCKIQDVGFNSGTDVATFGRTTGVDFYGDLDMHTYDIGGIDILRFHTGTGTADVLATNDIGIESGSTGSSSSLGMKLNVGTNQGYFFRVANSTKMIINDATDSRIKVYSDLEMVGEDILMGNNMITGVSLASFTDTSGNARGSISGSSSGSSDAIQISTPTSGMLHITESVTDIAKFSQNSVEGIVFEADLDMKTYNIVNPDLIKFSTSVGSGTALTSSEYGMEALYASSVAYGIQIRVPTAKSIFFRSGTTATATFDDINGFVTGMGIYGGKLQTGGYVDFDNIQSPSNPSTNHVRLFADSDNSDHLTVIKSDGSEVDLEAGGGGSWVGTATSDLDMNGNHIKNTTSSNGGHVTFEDTIDMRTYNIQGVDQLIFSNASNSNDVLGNSDYGIEIDGGTSDTGLRYNVNSSKSHKFYVGGGSTPVATIDSSGLDAGDIGSGTVNVARLGSGATSSKYLRGDNTWQTISSGNSAQTFNQANFTTNHSEYDIWHPLNWTFFHSAGQGSQLVGLAPSTTKSYVYPLFVAETKKLYAISPYVSSASSGRMDVAIYSNKTNGENYPNSRLATDYGNFLNFSGMSTNAGFLNYSLSAGLYWIIIKFSSNASQIYHAPADWHNMIGWIEDDDPSTTGALYGWREDNPSSTFPSTYTGIGDSDVDPIKGSTGNIPLLWAKWTT